MLQMARGPPKKKYIPFRTDEEQYKWIMDRVKDLGPRWDASKFIRAALLQYRFIMENPLFVVLKETDLNKVLKEPLVMSMKRLSELKSEET